MSITFNLQTILQPSKVTEAPIQIQSDTYSIQGNMQRNRTGQKYSATLEWDDIPPAEYRTIMNFLTTGSGFFYKNDQSAETADGILTFSGLPSAPDPGEYVPGASLYKNLKVSIREI